MEAANVAMLELKRHEKSMKVLPHRTMNIAFTD